MAESVGSLTVRLGLDASDYLRGLNRSEKDAQRFAQQLEQNIATAARGAGVALGLVVAAASAALVAIDQLAKQAGNFKDLEEITGANAESLASFAVSAAVAGVEMSTVAEASVKLTKSLTDVDDESKAAGAALTALGIPIKEFKKLDPATQLETVAKALAGFEDGSAKTAVAVALLGKAGAQLLPFLKELASEGGRQVILTQRQIELADEYADKQARARAELNLYAQVAATQALPAITDLIKVAKDFIAELIGIDTATKTLRDSGAIRQFTESVLLGFANIVDVGDSVVRIFQGIGLAHAAQAAAAKAVLSGNFSGAREVITGLQNDLNALLAKQQLSARLAEQFAATRRNESLNEADTRITGRSTRPRLNFDGAADSKSAKAAKAKTDEAERYIETLERQVQASLKLSHEETALVAIYDLRNKSLAAVSAAQEATILDYARQLDATEALKKAQEDAKRLAEEDARTRERMADATRRSVEEAKRELESIKAGNEQIKEQIILTRDGEAALLAYTQAKLLKIAAEKEDLAAASAAVGANAEQVKAIRDQAAALRERSKLLGDEQLAKKMADDLKTLQDQQAQILDIAGTAVADFVSGTKSAKDALKSLIKDLDKFLIELALKNLKQSILGQDSGGGIFGMLAKLFGSAFAGGGGSFAGGGGSGGFALGGVSRGGLSLVGEQGPELVSIPAGARVKPNNQIRGETGGGLTIVQNIERGANTQAHREAALSAFKIAAGAARRR